MMALMCSMAMMIPMSFSSDVMFLMQFMHVILFIYLLILNYNMFISMVSYNFGLDSFSYGLILLSLLISPFMIISMNSCFSGSLFLLNNLFLSLSVLIIFGSLNFLFMYMSFEFVLLPLVILILGWGYQPERLMAGMYMFFYTVIVSLPLLLLIIYIYLNMGSLFFDYLKIDSFFFLEYFILVIVFMVKLPMYMLHFWLPKAHVQAPVSGSMVLAGLMLKIGGYGLIRISYIFEYMFFTYSYFWFSVSLVGSVLISIICLVQCDIKCLIAYSSVSHMGVVIMGLMTMKSWGIIGSFLLMLSHGLCSSGLFYMANLFYCRTNSRSFFINSGLMMYMPSCSMIWFLFCIFNMSCPPSINFLSEFMILTSMMFFWEKSFVYFLFMSFFCACFSYYLYSFSQHGMYHNFYSFAPLVVMEFLALFLHLFPLVFAVLLVWMFI
uniref:NADH dehydrogenase subunit 4 n=1 Tax=Arrugada affinis TaxID=706857 RepID=UPI002E7A587E|nr:NADH dehydrogenase subunit 4 [Arrugada affinis]WRK21422.1 NADH dehydrogenase subunit 4 [Arrugada affinis]